MLQDKPEPVLYRAVAYHHFKLRDAYILFDVAALRVHRAVGLDRSILEFAKTPRPLSEIRSTDYGVPTEDAADRVDTLVASRFLLPVGLEPDLAPLPEPSDYATFMINVSQRCNLTCPYCYVNKGHFDYVETPIPKLPAGQATELVNRIYFHFPHFRIYGYHFYGGEPLLNFAVIRALVDAAEAKAATTGTKADYHITTNGTLLSREVADFMDQYRFTVYLSIDSDQDTHDELRRYRNGRGSYADVETAPRPPPHRRRRP
jgi:uncharacterized protein